MENAVAKCRITVEPEEISAVPLRRELLAFDFAGVGFKLGHRLRFERDRDLRERGVGQDRQEDGCPAQVNKGAVTHLERLRPLVFGGEPNGAVPVWTRFARF